MINGTPIKFLPASIGGWGEGGGGGPTALTSVGDEAGAWPAVRCILTLDTQRYSSRAAIGRGEMRGPIEALEEATDTDLGSEPQPASVVGVLERSAAAVTPGEATLVRSVVEDLRDGSCDLDEAEERAFAELLDRLRDAPVRPAGDASAPVAPDDATPDRGASGAPRRPRERVVATDGGQRRGTDEDQPATGSDRHVPDSRDRPTGGGPGDRVPDGVRRLVGVPARLRIAEWAYLAGIAFAWLYVYLYDLGGFELRMYDEAVYARAAQRTLDGPVVIPHVYFNHWAEPYHAIVGYQPVFLKPPLGIWLQSLSMALFGTTKFAARLPSAVLMLATAVLLYAFARDVYDRHTAGFAAIVFLTIPQLFARTHGGRAGTLEVPLLFFGTAFVCCVWAAVDRDDPRWLLPMGIAGGLAVLTKGLGAGVFVLVVAPLVAVYWRRFLNVEMAVAVGLTTALVGTWTAYAYLTYGDYFTQVMVVDQVVDRVTGSNAFVRDEPTTFSFMKYAYFRRFPWLAGPWAHFVVPAVVVAGVHAIRRRRPRLRRDTSFLVWWMAVVFGFFVLTGNQPWYVIPMFVPLSILVGYLGRAALLGDRGARYAVLAGAASVVAFSGRLAGTVPSPFPRHEVLLDGGLPFLLVVVLLPVVFTLAPKIGPVVRETVTQGTADVSRFVVPLVLIVVVTATVAAPVQYHSTYTEEQEALGDTATDRIPADAQLYTYEIGTTPIYTFLFFYDDDIRSVAAGDLEGDPEIRYVLTQPRAAESIDRSYRVHGTVSDPRYAQWGNVTLIELHEPDHDESGTDG